MSKKEKIHIAPNENLASIDEELDAALGLLQQANDKVSELLTTIEVDRSGEDGGFQAELEPAAADAEAATDAPAAGTDGS